MAKTAAEKRAILEAEIDKLKKQEKLEAKEKDQRKKLVIGEFVLRIMKADGIGAAALTYGSQSFDRYLTNQNDRELFGLVTTPPVQVQPVGSA